MVLMQVVSGHSDSDQWLVQSLMWWLIRWLVKAYIVLPAVTVGVKCCLSNYESVLSSMCQYLSHSSIDCYWRNRHFSCYCVSSHLPPLDNIRVMVIVRRLRGNIIRTALCWIVWHNVHSPQHTYVSSSYRSNRLGLSHSDPCTVHGGSCLELCCCNMVEWFWWDSSLILTTNWFLSVLWHCWFGHLACKNVPEMTYYVSSGTLNPTHSLTHSYHFSLSHHCLFGAFPWPQTTQAPTSPVKGCVEMP